MIKKISKEEIERFILDAGSDDLPTFGGKFEGGIHCQQVPDELASCIADILDSGVPVKSYLEIGAAAGGTAFLISNFFHPEKIVLVDDNRHPKTGDRPRVLKDVPHDEIIGNSHDGTTVAIVRGMGIMFDLLLVDGDHLYHGVKSDVGAYGEFLKPDGLMIFHDSRVGIPHGCMKVFEELKEDPSWELLSEYVSEKHHPCGIGLFRKATS